ncbi:phosphoribosylformylglycinamidine synthase, partial [Coemansia linderi]
MPMLVVPGRASAVSGFRLTALLAKFPFPTGAITSIDAHHVHFLDIADTTDIAALHAAALANEATGVWSVISTLLCGPGEGGLAPKAPILLNSQEERPDPNERRIWVLPRSGTISPWSSKATDIFHLCGLRDVVARVERGVVYRLEFAKGFAPDFKLSEHRLVIEAGSDRMTETLYDQCPEAHEV